VSREADRWIPLAAIAAAAAPEESEMDRETMLADLPIAYVPRGIGVPEAGSFREVLERSWNWGRR
jgi:hypothetical protein